MHGVVFQGRPGSPGPPGPKVSADQRAFNLSFGVHVFPDVLEYFLEGQRCFSSFPNRETWD